MAEMKTPDFTDFKPKGQSQGQAKISPKIKPMANRWWLSDNKTLPFAVLSQVAAIIQADRGRIESYNTYAKLYGTYTPTFWNGYQLSNSGRPTAPMRDRLTYNIVQSCIDTLTSRMIQNKPKPMFLTSAGNSKVQRKAKKLDQFCYGLFYENGVYKTAPKIFRDGCVFGEGIYHPYAEAGRIRFERVLPYEILVDYLESHYGPESTRSLHRIKNIDRTELMEMYPEHAEAIAMMSGTSHFISSSQRSVADTVTVVESWRLPVGGKPGVHTMVTENTILLREDYTDDFFPFAIFRYNPRLYGFYAQSMAEQLLPIQIEINRTLISIQRSLYMGGTHKIFVKNGSKVIKSHFDNMVGTVLEYAGDTPPQYVVPQLVQPEIYSHLQTMIGMGYQQPGVSQLSAASQKPMGIDSGKALRTIDDIEVQRFQTVGQAYEGFFVDLSKIVVAVAKKTYSEDRSGSKLSVKVPGSRFIEKIDWKDVDMDEDEFVLQIYPVSKLPQDPEGRLQTIQEMMQAGLLSQSVGKRLLDFPDLDAEMNLENANLDYLHQILDGIVDDGDYRAPEPDDDLVMAKQLVLEYIAQGKLNRISPERLEDLRNFNKQIDALNEAAQPPAMMGAPGAPGAPPMPGGAPANPEATPTSDLVPNLNGAQAGA